MLTPHDILLGILIPFLSTTFLTPTLPLLSRNRLPATPLSLSLGFALGCILLFHWPGLPPLNDFDWLIPFSLLTALIPTLAQLLHWRHPWAYGALIPLLTWLLIHTQLPPLPLLALMATSWLWWIALDSLLHHQPPAPRDSTDFDELSRIELVEVRSAAAGSPPPTPSPTLTMTLLSAFTSLILLLSDSQHLAQLALSLTASTAALWLLTLFSKNPLPCRPTTLACSTLLLGLLLNGKFWAGLTWTNSLLILASPLLPYLLELPPLRPRTPWLLTTLRLSLTLLPLLLALTLAILSFQHAQQSPTPDYY